MVDKPRDINICYYCKLNHSHVEASGLWACPNPLCTGPGGAYFRSTLKSYREIGITGKHTVDEAEWTSEGLKKLMTLDTSIIEHVQATRPELFRP